MEYEARCLPPEHPRASSSDDCECMFSLMHEMLGDIFDMKQFHDCQAKIFSEFAKRCDPNLKFYYWTGAKERFRDFDQPSFNTPSGEGVQKGLTKYGYQREETRECLLEIERHCRKKEI